MFATKRLILQIKMPWGAAKQQHQKVLQKIITRYSRYTVTFRPSITNLDTRSPVHAPMNNTQQQQL
jgi:hypothetical protein